MRALRRHLRFVASLLALALVVFTCANPVRAQVAIIGGGGSTFNGGAVTGATSFLDTTNFSWKNTADTAKVVQVDASNVTTANTVVGLYFAGTAATPELWVGQATAANKIKFKHNGTDAGIDTGTGALNFSTGGTVRALINGSGNTAFGSGTNVGFSANADPTGTGPDAFITRAASNVIRAGSGAGWIQNSAGRVRLSSDYTNATATFSNTAISFSVTSGRVYSFVANLYLSESTAADGVKLDFNGGSATSTNFVATCNLTNAVGAILTQTNATTAALATVINIAATTDANVHLYSCSGTFEPSSTSTFIIRAAQNSHSTGTLTIKRGSFAYMEDMP